VTVGKHFDLYGLVTERDLNEEIAKVAYGLYKNRGTAAEYDFEDWLKAEKIVMEHYSKLKKDEIDLMSKAAEKKASRRVAKKQTKSR
jgi:hypothetical protein